jgi:predicted dehydrogenase
MTRLRWGVLGGSPFLVRYSMPEISRGTSATLVAVASRSLERAQDIARRVGAAQAYGSYEELIRADDIDVVYITLPNHLHVEWCLKALGAGKHVLCEKPLAPSAHEARALAREAASYDTFLFEGHMWRCHPQWEEVRHQLTQGAIGTPGLVRMHYSYFTRDAESARNDPNRGGGALNMIGCYPAAMGNFVFANQEPRRALARIDIDPELGVDGLACAIVEYDEGHLEFTVSQQLWDQQTFTVNGTTGWLRVELPVTPGAGDTTRLHIDADAGQRTIEVSPASQFALQADAVGTAIRSGTRPDLTSGLRALDILDAVKQSGQIGAWVQISRAP